MRKRKRWTGGNRESGGGGCEREREKEKKKKAELVCAVLSFVCLSL